MGSWCSAVRSPHHFGGSGVNVFNCSTVRVLGAVALARRHPEAKLVLVGRGLFPVGYSDFRALLGFVVNEGIAPARHRSRAGVVTDLPTQFRQNFEFFRSLLEEKSRTTRENAVFAKQLLRPAPGQTWVLITSAYDMPRSVDAFTAAGWQVIPYPVDFSIDGRTELRACFSLVSGFTTALWAATNG